MKSSLSRRDFLKLAGVGLGALAFKPFNFKTLDALYAPKRLPQFPNSEIIGRLVDKTDIRSRPTNDPLLNTSIGTLTADSLIPWEREVIGSVAALTNQKYLETQQGYIWSSRVQPTRNLPNTPITAVPAGQPGFWAEVTVPYVDLTLEGTAASPWLKSLMSPEYNFPPRLYYGQVVWIDQVRLNNGFVEYRWNEGDQGHGYGYGAYGEFFWFDGAGVKALTEEDVAPISPDFDPAQKKIIANLTYQTLSCYEGTTEVYFCRIASGQVYDPLTGEISEEFATPTGELMTHWKIISKNMTAGNAQSGYSTPAVPWNTFISGEGVAIHGAFWHNDFGERRSHGCINVKPEDAKWIFRWTTPYVSLAQSEMRMTYPDHGTLVGVTELKV